jgi:uncharacterized membrane protein
MPNLAANHPQVVHFVIALLIVGVLFRVISLTGRVAFTKHAATVLLLLGTIAGGVAVKSGVDAHGPAERIPGARDLVVHHEELGIKTRNVFYGVAAIEIVALALGLGAAGAAAGSAMARAAGFTKLAYAASALVGIYGTAILYETAEHGGELVYEYAAGPGLRTGDPEDVERLLLAGLYQQSVADRRAGRGADAARLINEMASRFPNDTTIKFLQVESLLIDVKDPSAALAAARAIGVDPANPRFVNRKASVVADAFVALGMRDSARVVLEPVVAANPQNTRLKAKLDSLR